MMLSVIMPSYNSGLYIREALESVLLQNFSDFEVIIQDACSTDQTESIVRSFGDDRIKFYQEHDRGQSHIGIEGVDAFLGHCLQKIIVRSKLADLLANLRRQLGHHIVAIGP